MLWTSLTIRILNKIYDHCVEELEILLMHLITDVWDVYYGLNMAGEGSKIKVKLSLYFVNTSPFSTDATR